MISYPYQEGNGFSFTNKLDLLRVFVFARQITASGAIPAGLLYLTTNSSKLVEIPQSVQSKFIKIMKTKMNLLESMQESNLLTIPFVSGRLYRLTNRL